MSMKRRLLALSIAALSAVGAVVAVGPIASATGGGGSTGCPTNGCIGYQTISSVPYCKSGTNLAQIRNTTAYAGAYTVGQQIGATYTFSGSVSGTVGDTSKLAATLGFSYTTSKTFTASGTHTLQPGQTLRLSPDTTRYYVKQSKANYAGGPVTVTYIYVYKPVGVCTVIF